MYARRLRFLLLSLVALALCTPLFFCNTPTVTDAQAGGEDSVLSPWRNVYDTSARYVGMTACRGCHEDIYQSFMQTGMGQSFDTASRQKSAADFSPEHALVYDKNLNFYYKPFWRGDSLFIMEYRLGVDSKDTVHQLVQRIDYIIGSGQHTNSHIFQVNNYFYQAPITYYTQKKQWDLAPGFEEGANSRFSRLIQSECMTCHNGYPEFVANSQNKFLRVKHGIDCERCHGPGSFHVAEKRAGKIVDTSKGPDYSIVNPRRLSTELQNNVCMRCHLQGITVLNDDKTFFDFRPGMRLSEVMNTFMPEYTGAEDKMIMASHVERMKKSPCYLVSGKMSCITCHDPHVSVKFTPREKYLNACQKCHTGATTKEPVCTESPVVRAKVNDDCVTCHMPQNGSIDIPHVAVTDHYIRKRPGPQGAGAGKITAFLGLKSYNNDNPDDITVGRAYLEFYERYGGGTALIDSALLYLNRNRAGQKLLHDRDFIRAWYLQKEYGNIIQKADGFDPSALTDAWTAYRMGEAYFQTGQPERAFPFYKRAIQIWPFALDFQNKYGACLLALQRVPEAEKVFAFVLKENPRHPLANANMGFVQMQLRNRTEALAYLKKALNLNPDHEQTLINLAIWHHGAGEFKIARMYLLRAQKLNPGNEQVKAMLEDLRES